ncbi:MAG: hypothetical protein EOP06_32320, partial [Proteobacteria bacterium]
MTPTLPQTGFVSPEFRHTESSAVAKPTMVLPQEMWNHWSKPVLLSAALVIAVVVMLAQIPTGLNHPLSAVLLAVVGFCVARLLGLSAGVSAIAIT